MFGNKTYKVVDEVKGHTCIKCSHNRKFKVVIESKWFLLLIFPLFPYKKRKLFVCSVCGAAYEVKGKLETMVKETTPREEQDIYPLIKKQLDDGEITENEYIRMCNLIKFKGKDIF